MIYDLDSVNSVYWEDYLHECKLEESNINVECDPFITSHTNDTVFTYDLTTSSLLKDIIETSSRKIRANVNEMLTSFDKDSSQSFSLSPEKYFTTASGNSSSADRNDSSTLKISNIYTKS